MKDSITVGLAEEPSVLEQTRGQELLTLTADVVIDVFAAESGWLRASGTTPRDAALDVAAAEVYVTDAAARVEVAARSALAGMADGDTLRTLLAALRRLLKPSPVNTIARRRQIADAIVARKAYPYA